MRFLITLKSGWDEEIEENTLRYPSRGAQDVEASETVNYMSRTLGLRGLSSALRFPIARRSQPLEHPNGTD